MAAKKNRWLAIAVMGGFTLIFLGTLLILPLAGLFSSAPPTVNSSPSPSASPIASKERLAEEAKGYEIVLQREPENQMALKQLAEIRIAQGELKLAIAPIEKLAQLNPGDPGVGLLLAKVRERTGDVEGAKQAYRETLKARPVDVTVLQEFRNFLVQQNQPEAAIGLLQDTVRNAETLNRQTPGAVKTEELVSVQLLLGETYARQERFNDAIAQYDKAIQADNQDFRPLVAKALVLRQQGKDAEAKPLFISAAALAPAQFKDLVNNLAAGQPPATAASPGASPSAGGTAAGAVTSSPSPAAAPAASPASTPASPATQPAN